MYNENEPFAMRWLGQLQERNLIPEGKIDGRSITDIRPEDCDPTSHFFAGIGGWAYALQLAGWDPARPVWTGSCPCQPFSIAGKGTGTSDKRHLWPIWRDLIAEYRPATIFGEQTSSKLGREWLSGVRTDLEELGYAVGAADLCAASVNAPHRRQRLYWVAYTGHSGNRRWDGLRDSEAEPIGPEREDQRGGQGRQDQAGFRALDVPTDGGSEYTGHDPLHGLVNPLRGGAIDNDTKAEQGGYGPQHGLPGPTGASGGGSSELANTSSERCDGEPVFLQRGESRQAIPEITGSSEISGRDRELADTTRQCIDRGRQTGPRRWDEHTNSSPVSLRDFWDDYDIAVCTEIDGTTRARRIEPGTMPLVTGISNRVGLIKGYGNAIVPQLAATFIRAFLEAEEEG